MSAAVHRPLSASRAPRRRRYRPQHAAPRRRPILRPVALRTRAEVRADLSLAALVLVIIAVATALAALAIAHGLAG
jgi:hypothetical protein